MALLYNKYDAQAERKPHQAERPQEFINSQIEASLDEQERVKLFTSIEIETVNRCNLDCPFCPAARSQDIRQEEWMEETLFYKIISDLKEIEYKGKIALYSNNEPFLDRRLPEFIKYAKQQLPLAHHRLYTNGTKLTLELFLEVMQWLDSLVIDQYNDNLMLNNRINEIFNYCNGKEYYENRVEIHLRKVQEQLTSRGGQAKNRKPEPGPPYGCFLPFVQMVVRPSGEVSLCCSDPYGRYSLGDLKKQTPQQVWYGDGYAAVRRLLRKNRQQAGPLCRNCDMIK